MKRLAEDIKGKDGVDIWNDEWQVEILVDEEKDFKGYYWDRNAKVDYIPIKEYKKSEKRSEEEIVIPHIASHAQKQIMKLKATNPTAKIIAHPECEEPVLAVADFIGSTTGLLNYTIKESAKEFIVATETGIIHQMQLKSPQKTFIPAPPNNNCACNDCPHMKLNTLEKLYLCLRNETPELIMEESLRLKAEKPIKKMLQLSIELGIV
jgi:quinolinate synthetase A subunit